MSQLQSLPYHPSPEGCCEACLYGEYYDRHPQRKRPEHAGWCARATTQFPDLLYKGLVQSEEGRYLPPSARTDSTP